jgi:hypothetical protein
LKRYNVIDGQGEELLKCWHQPSMPGSFNY